MTKIIKFNFNDTELHAKAMAIRTQVFVVEQGVPEELEHEYEAESTHFLLFDKAQAIATARYRRTDKGIKLERFAVLKSYRSQGIGFKILRFMLTDLAPYQQTLYLHAQVGAVNFYKQNGFIITGGKFEEAGIEHYPMEYDNEELLKKALEKAICRR